MLSRTPFSKALFLTISLFILIPSHVISDDKLANWQQMPKWLELSDEVRSAYYKDGNSRGESTIRLGTAMRLAMFTAANGATPTYKQYLDVENNTHANGLYAAGVAAAEVLKLGYGEKYLSEREAAENGTEPWRLLYDYCLSAPRGRSK